MRRTWFKLIYTEPHSSNMYLASYLVSWCRTLFYKKKMTSTSTDHYRYADIIIIYILGSGPGV